ncbi:uncharacterized protein [Nicotiana sylvestris]|uniref:uncharacterized protein n=1 Tax=Nicotiana sylvestris TaxID=4096 RepID=UPI00388C87B3
MVTAWILNSLDTEIRESVMYTESAQKLWKEIKQRYGKVNGTKVFQIRKDLASISQGSSNIASYFSRIKKLWDELDYSITYPDCFGSKFKRSVAFAQVSDPSDIGATDNSTCKSSKSKMSSASQDIPSVSSNFAGLIGTFAFSNCASYLVTLPSGYKVKVHCTGSLYLSPNISLPNDLFLKKLVVLGRLQKGIYILQPSDLCDSDTSSSNSSINTIIANVDIKNKSRSDNAFELGGSNEAKTFFCAQGILYQTSCSHTLQQNIVVERKHKHLLEIARALLFQSKLPLNYWDECVLTATYLINRFPSPLLQHKSPFELLHGYSPSFSHLKAFGYLYFAAVPKPYRDKFKSRTIPSIFIGYSSGKKAYKLLNLSS